MPTAVSIRKRGDYWYWTAAVVAAAIVPPLYLCGCFRNLEELGVGMVQRLLCPGWKAHELRHHRHTLAPLVAFTKRKASEVRAATAVIQV